MPGKQRENLAFGHFGRQVRKERIAHGWDLEELARQTGINAGHLSRIERGVRPPTETVAKACDRVFPERKGWFLEYWEDSRAWTPPGYRSWPEYEDKARILHAWSPVFLHGLLQTERYARALLETSLDHDPAVTKVRLANRMDRQRRVLGRNDPPEAIFLVDLLSLYREVGGPETMGEQMDHLASVATRKHVTIQVLPPIAHPVGASELIVTEEACYAEHVLGGFVHVDEQPVTMLSRQFDTLRGECYRVSESLALIREVGEYLWKAGERAATAKPTVDRA